MADLTATTPPPTTPPPTTPARTPPRAAVDGQSSQGATDETASVAESAASTRRDRVAKNASMKEKLDRQTKINDMKEKLDNKCEEDIREFKETGGGKKKDERWWSKIIQDDSVPLGFIRHSIAHGKKGHKKLVDISVVTPSVDVKNIIYSIYHEVWYQAVKDGILEIQVKYDALKLEGEDQIYAQEEADGVLLKRKREVDDWLPQEQNEAARKAMAVFAQLETDKRSSWFGSDPSSSPRHQSV